MSNYDNGFNKAQRDYDNQSDDWMHEDEEKEQRRREAEEHEGDIEREDNSYEHDK